MAKRNGSAGKVSLVGAGPGDAELLTLKAVRAIGEADVVLVDELVDEACLAHASPRARTLRVGKRGGCKSTPQAFITRLMIHLARRGSRVVRLKGGDPFIFGRGGEELVALRAAGVEVEVIPGITAGVGAAGALGLPLTLRGVSRGVTFITGHTARHDWNALHASGMTLVVYMAMAELGRLQAAMLQGGFHADTPCCVAQSAGLPTQREMLTTLGDLVAGVFESGMQSPAVIIVGDVARLARAEPFATRKLAEAR